MLCNPQVTYLNGILLVITEGADDQAEGHSADALEEGQEDDPDRLAAGRDVEDVDHERQDQGHLGRVQKSC